MHRLTFLGLTLGIAAACADIPDPNHCWNRQRDTTCAELYPRQDTVCSPCSRGYSGCVDRDKAPACADEESSSDGSSSGDTTD